MDTNQALMLVFGIALVVLFFLMIYNWRLRRRHRKILKNIPVEILNDFKELEETYQYYNGEVSHQEILWNYYKDKHLNLPQEIKNPINISMPIVQEKKSFLNKIFGKKNTNDKRRYDRW